MNHYIDQVTGGRKVVNDSDDDDDVVVTDAPVSRAKPSSKS